MATAKFDLTEDNKLGRVTDNDATRPMTLRLEVPGVPPPESTAWYRLNKPGTTPQWQAIDVLQGVPVLTVPPDNKLELIAKFGPVQREGTPSVNADSTTKARYQFDSIETAPFNGSLTIEITVSEAGQTDPGD